MAMFGGCSESEEAAKLREVRTKLLDDRAKKEWAAIFDVINGMVGDIRGRAEAIAFCKTYLKRFVSMSSDVAKDCGLPPEIAHILSFHLRPMLDFAIVDRYEQIVSDQGFMDELFKQMAGTPALSDKEVTELEAEAELLKSVVQMQKESDAAEDVKNVYDDEDDQELDFDPTSELDPNNPFGLK